MNILIATDLSETSNSTIDYVKKLRAESLIRVWLLHVAEPDPDFVGYDADPVLMRDQTAKKYHMQHCRLQQLSQELNSAGVDCTALLVQGAIVETILDEAEKLSIDTIVVESHGKGTMTALFTGSTVTDIAHKAARPVLVIPDSWRSRL